jgi:hypothetical protein
MVCRELSYRFHMGCLWLIRVWPDTMCQSVHAYFQAMLRRPVTAWYTPKNAALFTMQK